MDLNQVPDINTLQTILTLQSLLAQMQGQLQLGTPQPQVNVQMLQGAQPMYHQLQFNQPMYQLPQASLPYMMPQANIMLAQQQQQQQQQLLLAMRPPPASNVLPATAQAALRGQPGITQQQYAMLGALNPNLLIPRGLELEADTYGDLWGEILATCTDDDPLVGPGVASLPAVGEESVSPNFPLAEVASSWSSLTPGLINGVMQHLSTEPTVPKILRLVCKHWRAAVDQNIEQLSPRYMKTCLFTVRFPNLKMLHLTHCTNIRNRDLFVLSRSGVRLHTLTLGDNLSKPWVTNRGLAFISHITTLTSLNLQDCNSLTNNGLMVLQRLSGLLSLSLKGCRKLTNAGTEALVQLTSLRSLNLLGVQRLSDKGLQPLTRLQLTQLQLGHTRVRDEGITILAQLTSLRSLGFVNEEFSSLSGLKLTALSQLNELSLRDVPALTGALLANLIPSFPLQTLDVSHNWSFNDTQLDACLPVLSSITALDLSATWVSAEAVGGLSQLDALRSLTLTPQPERWCNYALALPKLTQLTSLALLNLTFLPVQLLDSLRLLTHLGSLDLSLEPAASQGPAAMQAAQLAAAAAAAAGVPFSASAAGRLQAAAPAQGQAQDYMPPQVVRSLGLMRSLTDLNLSRRPLRGSDVTVIGSLPHLTRLVAIDCNVPDSAIAYVSKHMQSLAVQR